MKDARLSPLEEITVSQVMTRHVEKIGASASVFEAVQLMVELNIGSLAVVSDDKAGGLAGLLPVYQTLQHLLRPSQGRDVLVKDVMFTDYVTSVEDETLAAVIRRVTSNKAWRLIVLGPNRQPVGVVSVTDIVRWLAGRAGGAEG